MPIPHELPLVTTIAVGLGMAFVCGFVAVKLRMPPVVGYLLAGILVGPHTPGFLVDMRIAEELSEIGIVLLMFGVGLHFSLKDMVDVRRIATTGALSRIIIGSAMGAGLAHLWGWPLESGLVFGLALSVASTVVLLKSFEEHNLLRTVDGHIAIGWLIIEDLIMILALVLIPALAGGGETGGHSAVGDLLVTFGKIGLFVFIMVVVGKRLLPALLGAVAKTRSRELFTLAVIAGAIGIAFAASKLFGISFALGAFFAGMMIRESELNHEVANRILPFQDAFAVLFFVAVGMLFNPGILLDQPLNVLLVVLVIMFGKSLVTLGTMLIFGYPLRNALTVSAGLAQIGEFSFILITLGLSLGLLPEEGRDLVLAGAMISIALNPVLFWACSPAHAFVARSARLSRFLNMRADDLAHLRSDQKRALKNTVILVGHGRVGRQISKNIQAARIDLVIIDTNRERIEALRTNDFHAIVGDASQAETLKEAEIAKAVAIAVAVPDAFEARRIVEAARKLRPDIKILVRAHNEEERDFFISENVDLAVTGPREIGRRMVEFLNEMKQA
jgi:monovalent cation:H+ antiporter-2, CPA2 family